MNITWLQALQHIVLLGALPCKRVGFGCHLPGSLAVYSTITTQFTQITKHKSVPAHPSEKYVSNRSSGACIYPGGLAMQARGGWMPSTRFFGSLQYHHHSVRSNNVTFERSSPSLGEIRIEPFIRRLYIPRGPCHASAWGLDAIYQVLWQSTVPSPLSSLK